MLLPLLLFIAAGIRYRRFFFGENKTRLTFAITAGDYKISGSDIMVQLKPGQFVTGTVKPTDKAGNPAEVQNPQFSTDGGDGVITVEVDAEDANKVKVSYAGLGVATLKYSADADLGEGVTTIEATANFECVAGQAVGLSIDFGEPQDAE